MNEELEKQVNREWVKPNVYPDYPAPIKYWFKTEWNNSGYYRARCPVKDCQYDGLLHRNGFNQHYTIKHAPHNTRQHARRVINLIERSK